MLSVSPVCLSQPRCFPAIFTIEHVWFVVPSNSITEGSSGIRSTVVWNRGGVSTFHLETPTHVLTARSCNPCIYRFYVPSKAEKDPWPRDIDNTNLKCIVPNTRKGRSMTVWTGHGVCRPLMPRKLCQKNCDSCHLCQNFNIPVIPLRFHGISLRKSSLTKMHRDGTYLKNCSKTLTFETMTWNLKC